MIGKSLKVSGSLLKIETGSGRRKASDGRMSKHHRRSVHREACRPQGSRSPLRQFSPVKEYGDVDDDGLNVHGNQHRRHRNGEMSRIHRGSKPWHACREGSNTGKVPNVS